MTELHPSLSDIVPSVASSIYRRYNKFAELDDIKQECLAWALTRADYINELLSEEDSDQRRHNEARIAWQMRRVAERYARKEKAVKSGYQINDEAYYENATLMHLLPFVIASVVNGTVLDAEQYMTPDGQPSRKSLPAEGGNLLVTLLDIKKGYLKLEPEDKSILRFRYHEGYTLSQLADRLVCSVSTADRRIDNSLRKLQLLLGGNSPWR